VDVPVAGEKRARPGTRVRPGKGKAKPTPEEEKEEEKEEEEPVQESAAPVPEEKPVCFSSTGIL
jgi:hypothetical protein